MKKLIPLFLMLCCLVSVTACSKDEIVSNYNQALGGLPLWEFLCCYTAYIGCIH